MKLIGGGGKAYMKMKRYERGVFDSFSKRGSALYEADRRGGGERYMEPENDVPYRICSVSIARSLSCHPPYSIFGGSHPEKRGHLYPR